MLAEHLSEEPRYRDCAYPARLRRARDDAAAELGQGLRDLNRATEDVHPLRSERPQLTSSQAAVRGDIDRGAVPVDP